MRVQSEAVTKALRHYDRRYALLRRKARSLHVFDRAVKALHRDVIRQCAAGAGIDESTLYRALKRRGLNGSRRRR